MHLTLCLKHNGAAYGIVCADIDIDSKANDYDGGEGDDKSFEPIECELTKLAL